MPVHCAQMLRMHSVLVFLALSSTALAAPHVSLDDGSGTFGAVGLPARSADGKLVAVLHVETEGDGSAELRIMDVATDKVVTRLAVAQGTRDVDDRLAAMNALLGHGSWAALSEGAVVTRCAHAEGNCRLKAGELTVAYDEPRLVVRRGARSVVDTKMRAWAHGAGVRTLYVSADRKLMLVIVTTRDGSRDEEHLIRL